MDTLKEQVIKNIIFLITEGFLEEASQCLKQFQQIYQDDEDCYSLEAGLLIAKGNVNDALKAIQKGLLKNPWNIDLLQNQFFVSLKTKKSIEAVRSFAMLHLLGRGDLANFPDDFKFKKTGFSVLQGTMEIANQMNTLTKALNKQGVSACALNYYQTYLGYNSGQDISFGDCKTNEQRILKSKSFAAEALSKYDIFHFHFGTSLTFDNSDLPLLKLLGKRAIMHYWGSDVRRLSIARKYNPYVRIKVDDEQWILKGIEITARYITNCIVSDYEMYLYVNEFFPHVYFLPQAIDLSKYKVEERPSQKRLLLVHAPTNPMIKGTEYILRAVEELRKEYEFDFKLIQGLSHEEAQNLYNQADLIIDQILLGSYGLLSIEAMAMGKPVICWISDYMRERYPKELPIIIANPESITNVLRNTLKNQDALIELGKQGRNYVETYHDANKVVRKLINIYQKL